MRNFRAISVLPSLEPSPPAEVKLGRWTFRPFPWPDHEEPEELDKMDEPGT
jgi:hypothetical protein